MNGKFLLQGANIKTGKVLVLSCTNTLSWNLSNFLLNRDDSVLSPSLRPWVKNGRREKSRTGQQRRPGLKRVMQAALCGVMMFLLDGVRSGVCCNQLIFLGFSFSAQHENILSLFSNCNVLCVVIFVAFWGTFLCSCYISLLVSVTAFATHQPF